MFSLRHRYAPVETNAITSTVSGMPMLWFVMTIAFFVWGVVTTVLYATYEEDEVVAAVSVSGYKIAKDLMYKINSRGASVGFCYRFTEDLIENEDGSPVYQILGQDFVTSDSSTIELVYEAAGVSNVNYDSSEQGACFTNENGDGFGVTAMVHRDQAMEDPELLYGNFAIECFDNSDTCNVVTMEHGSALNLLEGFIRHSRYDFTGNIDVAGLEMNQRVCNRTRWEGSTRVQTDITCPGQTVTSTIIRNSKNKEHKKNKYGLNRYSWARRCQFDKETYSWTGPRPQACKDCADASDCRYIFSVEVDKNPGCFYPEDEDIAPYCWADFCRSQDGETNDSGQSCGANSQTNSCVGGFDKMDGANEHFCFETKNGCVEIKSKTGRGRSTKWVPKFGECEVGHLDFFTPLTMQPSVAVVPATPDQIAFAPYLSTPVGYTKLPSDEKLRCGSTSWYTPIGDRVLDYFVNDHDELYSNKYHDISGDFGSTWTEFPFPDDRSERENNFFPDQDCSTTTADLISASYCSQLCDATSGCTGFNMNWQHCQYENGIGSKIQTAGNCNANCGLAEEISVVNYFYETEYTYTKQHPYSCCSAGGYWSAKLRPQFGCYLLAGCTNTTTHKNEYIASYVRDSSVP